MAFFDSLNYSSCNEDGTTELQALAIGPGDEVACITGGGDRVFHMLLGNPKCVHAFDVNAVQNHLLELKMAAIRRLEYDSYVQFLGLHTSNVNRLSVYAELRSDLSQPAAEWFDRHHRMVASGVLYAGRWERYFGVAAWNLRLLRGPKIKRLFEFTDLRAQQLFVLTEWNTRLWGLILRTSFCRPAFRLLLNDPGFYANADISQSPGRYILERMTLFLNNHLARSSFMMALVFKGRFFAEDHYPLYLREENFAPLKSRLDRVRISNMSLFEMLESTEGHVCNKYSLSDVSSFLSDVEYEELFRRLSAKTDVRFCMREFLTNRRPPLWSRGPVRYLEELEEELTRQDLSFGYTFTIGEA
ncbi:MAG: DUF3419 family protein [bacterium]|nr:DUF3419 family protein [bacterium]